MTNLQKAIIGAITYVFSYLSGCINEMIIILAIFMCFDYITGVAVSKKKNTFDRNIGAWGAIKKFFYLIILVSGYLLDITVNTFAHKVGVDFNTFGSLGFAVTFYLIGNEGMSLYTNLINLGLPAPKFLLNVFQNIKALAASSVPKELTNNKKSKKKE
jgi:toxin secretion/phage lysis holin